MFTFNPAEARKIISEADSQPKEKQKYNISVVPGDFTSPQPSPSERERTVTKPKAIIKNELREQAQGDFNKLRIEMAKLSNTIFDEVQRGASTAELATLYEKIESFRPGLIELYNQTRHIEKTGKPAAAKIEPVETEPELFLLKDKKRKLISTRSKRSNLIKQWSAAGHRKLSEWQLDLDKLNAEYDLVEEQINKLSGK